MKKSGGAAGPVEVKVCIIGESDVGELKYMSL
jgi:hypothetical protein